MLTLFSKKAVIDGKTVRFRKEMTILDAARQAGIEIPTLCHIQNHSPTGVCRVCVVAVEGSRTLVGACHTPIAEGMVISTRSPKVLAVRKGVVELMLSAHTGECVNDPNAHNCGLHNLASDCEAGAPQFEIARPRAYPAEEDNPYVRRDLSKCIMCRRCITVCDERAGTSALSVGYRGFNAKIISGCDGALTADECRDCGVCIEYCPTGALSASPGFEPQTRVPMRPSAPETTRDRSMLLPLLKQELGRQGFLSVESMEKVANDLNLSVSEVFGVSSFYSFLPREGNGAHRIRICRCVPCHLKEGLSVINALKDVLGINPGETTPDGRFSLELVSCIGACDQAPAMLIDHTPYGNLNPDDIPELLRAL